MSGHEWTEGRGESMVLIHRIDDATSRLLARFYPADTTEAHLELLGRWLQMHGRPLAIYSDRPRIFEPQDKGRADSAGETQFGRALRELDIELIRARSPQAKGYASSCTPFVSSEGTSGKRRGSVRLIPCAFLGPFAPTTVRQPAECQRSPGLVSRRMVNSSIASLIAGRTRHVNS
jgi:hypothetical protein